MAVPTLSTYAQAGAPVSGDQLNTFGQTCDNVAQLRAFIGLTGIQVFMRGYVSPNDGGQGFFYWNAGGANPDDGGVTTIVPAGSSAGEWTRITGTGGSSSGTVTNVAVSH